jgi:hypothetical protein
MTTLVAQPVLALMLAIRLAASPSPAPGQCDDPLPIDPAVVTQEMKLEAFRGGDQAGPACHLRWEGGSEPTLMIYGPTALADLGREFASPKQAADQYAGESPKGVEPLPGVPNGYMVFDPTTPNRRVFVAYRKKVYMIVSQDRVPLAILTRAVLRE